MIIVNTLFAFLLSLSFPVQDAGTEKHIVRKHDNGQPYVVVYTQGPEHDRVKEELYYENGQLDYVGHFKDGVEHGEWIYYWPNGNKKSEEFYHKGSEHGLMYDYNESGEPIIEYKYMRGILLKKTELTAEK